MSAADLYRRAPTLPPLAVGEAEAAKLMGVSARTLWGMRQRGDAPPHRRIGSRIVYSVDALRAWLAAGDENTPTPAEPSAEGGEA